MKIHLIVDFMYLYYKYKFTIDSNRIRRLITDVAWRQKDGTEQLVKTDVSYIYYPLKEIEGFRRQFEKDGHNVFMSICFDSISMRKVENAEYKSNRTKKLSDQDFSQINIIRELLTRAKYNVYKITKDYGMYGYASLKDVQEIFIPSSIYRNLSAVGLLDKYKGKQISTIEDSKNPFEMFREDYGSNIAIVGEINPDYSQYMIDIIETPYGYEADDIIASLIHNYGNDFDFNVIYTPDTDLLVHINNRVGVNRYKTGKGHTPVSINNFSDYCSEEFKCNIPYNGLLLYKILCGDKSDVIKGQKGFGPKSFDRLVEYLDGLVDWTQMGSVEYVRDVIMKHPECFGSEAREQILSSLSLVGYQAVSTLELAYPSLQSTTGFRTEAYMPMGMKSLIE